MVDLAFKIVLLLLDSVPQFEAFIARLQDHTRTLQQATTDRNAADAQLDTDLKGQP